jgi:hypothetical protein
MNSIAPGRRTAWSETHQGANGPIPFIAWNDVDQAYEIKRVLPMDNEKGPGLAVEI